MKAMLYCQHVQTIQTTQIQVKKLVPITFAQLSTTLGKPTPVSIKVLMDSGGSGTVLCKSFAKKAHKKKTGTVKWTTMAGDVSTSEKAKIEFSLSECFDDRLMEWDVHLADSLGPYNMIIGWDVLTQ